MAQYMGNTRSICLDFVGFCENIVACCIQGGQHKVTGFRLHWIVRVLVRARLQELRALASSRAHPGLESCRAHLDLASSRAYQELESGRARQELVSSRARRWLELSRVALAHVVGVHRDM